MRKKCMAVALLFCMLTSSVPVETRGNSASDISTVQEIVMETQTESIQQTEILETNEQEDVTLQVGTDIKAAEDSLQSGDFMYGILGDGTVEIKKYLGVDSKVTIPDVIDEKSVTSIGNGAFSWRNNLRGIIIPDGLTRIGESAFCGCSSLRFVIIPDGVTSIGQYGYSGAFSGCTSLSSIMIPDTVTKIDASTFNSCENLSDIVYAGTEENWKKLDISSQLSPNIIIHYNSLMTQENITEDGFTYYAINDNTVITGYTGTKTEICIPEVIDGNKVTRIENEAFSYSYDRLKSITIPNGVTRIGNEAFSYSSLKSIIIPNGVIVIGNKAFNGCGSLNSIMIPDTVSTIGSDTFGYCENLDDIVYAGTEENWKKLDVSLQLNANTTLHYNSVMSPENTTEDGFKYYMLNNNAVITGYVGTKTEIIIPDGIDGKKVTRIGSYAFDTYGRLTSIIIQEGVTDIGKA